MSLVVSLKHVVDADVHAVVSLFRKRVVHGNFVFLIFLSFRFAALSPS